MFNSDCRLRRVIRRRDWRAYRCHWFSFCCDRRENNRLCVQRWCWQECLLSHPSCWRCCNKVKISARWNLFGDAIKFRNRICDARNRLGAECRVVKFARAERFNERTIDLFIKPSQRAFIEHACKRGTNIATSASNQAVSIIRERGVNLLEQRINARWGSGLLRGDRDRNRRCHLRARLRFGNCAFDVCL